MNGAHINRTALLDYVTIQYRINCRFEYRFYENYMAVKSILPDFVDRVSQVIVDHLGVKIFMDSDVVGSKQSLLAKVD